MSNIERNPILESEALLDRIMEVVARAVAAGQMAEIIDTTFTPEREKVRAMLGPEFAALSQVSGRDTVVEALQGLLTQIDDNTADCIDNDGMPYQSQSLADAIKAGHAAIRALASTKAGTKSGYRTDMENMPKDGRVFHVWAPGFEWPETVRWETYEDGFDPGDGTTGYWSYAETLLAEVTDSCGSEEWTHWRDIELPAPTAPAQGEE